MKNHLNQSENKSNCFEHLHRKPQTEFPNNQKWTILYKLCRRQAARQFVLIFRFIEVVGSTNQSALTFYLFLPFIFSISRERQDE